MHCKIQSKPLLSLITTLMSMFLAPKQLCSLPETSITNLHCMQLKIEYMYVLKTLAAKAVNY